MLYNRSIDRLSGARARWLLNLLNGVGMPSNSGPVVLRDEARRSFIDLVEQSVRQTIGQSLNYTSDFPGFIASPSPASGPFGIAKAVAQQSCRRWARGEAFANLPGLDGFYAANCGPYLDSLGENPEDGTVGVPFAGGQCSGVGYTVSVAGPGSPPGGPGVATRSGSGPVGGMCFVDAGFGNVSIGVLFNGACVTGGGGQALTVPSVQGQWQITGIVRDDGQPDDCGDPAPEYDPAPVPPGLPPLGPITVDLPGLGPVAVDVEFNPDGSIKVTLPDLGVEIEVPNPLAGGDEGSGGLGENPAGINDEPEIAPPVDGSGAAGDDDDFGDPPPGRIWIGAVVEVLGELEPWGVIPDTDSGNAVLTRVIGNASLIVPIEGGGSVRTQATQVRSRWSDHLLSITGLTATGIRVNINPALTYRLWRVSIKDPDSQEDPEDG